jgi:hypothetical protein
VVILYALLARADTVHGSSACDLIDLDDPKMESMSSSAPI